MAINVPSAATHSEGLTDNGGGEITRSAGATTSGVAAGWLRVSIWDSGVSAVDTGTQAGGQAFSGWVIIETQVVAGVLDLVQSPRFFDFMAPDKGGL